jgi:hypothetical protein
LVVFVVAFGGDAVWTLGVVCAGVTVGCTAGVDGVLGVFAGAVCVCVVVGFDAGLGAGFGLGFGFGVGGASGVTGGAVVVGATTVVTGVVVVGGAVSVGEELPLASANAHAWPAASTAAKPAAEMSRTRTRRFLKCSPRRSC